MRQLDRMQNVRATRAFCPTRGTINLNWKKVPLNVAPVLTIKSWDRQHRLLPWIAEIQVSEIMRAAPCIQAVMAQMVGGTERARAQVPGNADEQGRDSLTTWSRET
jgi:hypothetical protein